MNRTLSALLTACLISLAGHIAQAAPQAQDNLSGSKSTAYTYVEDSSNATVTLVSGVTDQYVTLYKIILSSSAADNVYLKCGSTQKTGKVYLGTNSGLDATYYPLYIRCGSGEALSLVKGTATTPVGVSIWFTQQP